MRVARDRVAIRVESVRWPASQSSDQAFLEALAAELERPVTPGEASAFLANGTYLVDRGALDRHRAGMRVCRPVSERAYDAGMPERAENTSSEVGTYRPPAPDVKRHMVEPDRPPTPTEESFGRLEAEIERYGILLDHLEAKIRTALGGEQPHEIAADTPRYGAHIPDRLADKADGLGRLNENLAHLIDRVLL